MEEFESTAVKTFSNETYGVKNQKNFKSICELWDQLREIPGLQQEEPKHSYGFITFGGRVEVLGDQGRLPRRKL